MSEKDEDHRIGGYKALMQYGIQMSQDHVNFVIPLDKGDL